MSDKMFTEPFVNIGGKRKYTVLLSIVTHTFLISAAIVAPLIAIDTIVLPSRFAMRAFATHPPLPPSLPPPRGISSEQPSVVETMIPTEAPREIAAESPIAPAGDPFGGLEYSAGIVSGGDYSAPPPSPPPAPAADQVPVPVGGDIKRPTKVQDVAPTYPAIARSARVEGIVIVEATIGLDGKVEDARILRSIPLLDAAALDAVRRWEYTPTLLNGRPIAIVMTVTVHFTLRS